MLTDKTKITDWTVVRNYDEFVDCINGRGIPDTVSFDHDLHLEHVRHFIEHTSRTGFIEYGNLSMKTGKHCADFLVNKVAEIDCIEPACYVHSANHVGRLEIRKSLFKIVGNNIIS